MPCLDVPGVLSRDFIYGLLQECIRKRDLQRGRHVYSIVILAGLESVVIFGDLLIRLFAICGKLQDASLIFDRILTPTVHTWNAIISAHAELGHSEKALELYRRMKQTDTLPNRFIFLTIIRLCSSMRSLHHGRIIHKHIQETDYLTDVLVGNALIDMYVKCMSLDEARELFDILVCRDLVTWSILISGYAHSGQVSLALQLFIDMQKVGILPNEAIFISMIKVCPDVNVVRWFHSQMIEGWFEPVTVLSNILIDTYAKFSDIIDASWIFDSSMIRDIVSWGAMIASHAQHGQGFCSLQLFSHLQQEGLTPTNVILSSALKACGTVGALRLGQSIHIQVISCGLKSDLVIGNTLIDMYGKCNSSREARIVFDGLVTRDDVSWGAMFSVYAQEDNAVASIDLLKIMEQEGVKPNKVVYLSLLKAYGSMPDISGGHDIHNQIVMSGLDFDNLIGSSLIDMYAEFGCLVEAREVFSMLSIQDHIAWSALVAGYAQHGQYPQALGLLLSMQKNNIKPDFSTLLSVLRTFDDSDTIDYGRISHEYIIYWSYESDLLIGNALVNMYGNAGYVYDASKVFDNLPEQNEVSWVAMMAVFIDHGYALDGIKHCLKMFQKGIEFDKVMLVYLLRAHATLGNVKQGQWLHHWVVIDELELDAVIASSLIDMYAKCGCLDDACFVLGMLETPNIASYGAMIAGYVRNGLCSHALELFDFLEQEGIEPSEATYVCCLKACGIIGALDRGRVLHKQLFVNGHMNVIIGSALIDMYAKSGCLEDACRIFDEMSERNVVSWGLMISLYTENGSGHRALELLDIMQQEGFSPRKPTFLSALKACSEVGALQHARIIHDQIIRRELDHDTVLENSIIDCYSRCGSMKEAHSVFDRLRTHDLVSWTALIVGYAHCTEISMVASCLNDMEREGIKLDEQIFMSILIACRRSGFLKEACLYFRCMSEAHGITPNVEHYNCVIDILSRGGYIEEAEYLIQSMHLAPDIVAWRSLLTCCSNFQNTDLSWQCFNEVSQRDPINGSAYALMSNVCNNWDGLESPYIDVLNEQFSTQTVSCKGIKDRFVISCQGFKIPKNTSILFFFLALAESSHLLDMSNLSFLKDTTTH